MPFSTRRILILDGRQDPTRRPIFLLGNYPRPPSPACTGVVRRDLPYVVEGHASACPQTVGVDVKCVALTLIKLKYYVSASIMKRNNQFELL